MKSYIETVFAVVGVGSYMFPTFRGLIFDSGTADMSVGETRIIGAIFMVGAAIVWCLPNRQKN